MADIEAYIKAELSENREVCPMCGRNLVIQGTTAATRYGVCERCYYRALADANRAKIEADSARRDYDVARQQLSRSRRKAGKIG
ncbi:MAG: hypothetical protein ACOYIK_04650 [Coriobacteriales bacterium]|jgi:formate dehydrogenase maturation protein FdhE